MQHKLSTDLGGYSLSAAAQVLLKNKAVDPGRVKMVAICSVCAESFQKYMKNFSEALSKLDPAQKGK